jgi:hypothetical protein
VLSEAARQLSLSLGGCDVFAAAFQAKKGGGMFSNNLSSTTIGWFGVATGIVGLLGFVFIILFFTAGQPFGTMNDFCIGIAAIMSLVLVWMLSPKLHAQSPLLSRIAFVIAAIGAVLVLVGSALAIFGVKGWFLSGLYMAGGNAMIGLWLLALSYSIVKYGYLPHGLGIFGVSSGVILALGLVAIPGIFRGIDASEYEISIFNLIWWASSIGYLAVYPVWCVLLGRTLLLK